MSRVLLCIGCGLADVRCKQLTAAGRVQVWPLQQTQATVGHTLANGRYIQMTVAVEQQRQQQQLLQCSFAASRRVQVTRPAAGCLAPEILSKSHVAQAASTAANKVLRRKDISGIRSWRSLKRLLDRCKGIASSATCQYVHITQGLSSSVSN